MNPWVLAGLASTSFIVALSGALMPGPLLTVTVGEAARRGFWAGPLIMVGHSLLELALVLVLLVGLGAWLNQPLILGLVGVLGAGMLGWMGLMTLKTARRGRLELDAGDGSGLNPVLAGVLMSAANPYWLLWWLTIGLGYVMFSAKYGLAGVALFYLGHILADFAWYTLVSGAVAGAAVSVGRPLPRLSDRLRRFPGGLRGLFRSPGGKVFSEGVSARRAVREPPLHKRAQQAVPLRKIQDNCSGYGGEMIQKGLEVGLRGRSIAISSGMNRPKRRWSSTRAATKTIS